MVNTKELMLGNLLFLKYYDDEGKEQKTIVDVESIREDCVYFKRTCYRTSAAPKELEHIQLNSSILLPFTGVNYVGGFFDVGDKVELCYVNKTFYHSVSSKEYIIEPIESLHQLQNLLNVYGDEKTSDILKLRVLGWWNNSQK